MSKNASKNHSLPVASPRVASMVFRDFDEFSEHNGVIDIEFLQLESAPVDSRATRVVLDRMVLMRGWENTSYVSRTAAPSGTAALLFQLGRGGASWWRGREVNQRTLLSYQRGAEHIGRSTGGDAWAAVFIPTEALADASIALRGVPPVDHEGGAAFLAPNPLELGMLRSAVQHAFEVAESAPCSLELASIRSSLESSILRATVGALDPPGERREPDGPLVSHQRVVAKAEEALAEAIDAPIYVADLCRAAGVSERTLRNAFQSLYRVSPIRLLQLRRLHQVRRVLRDESDASVTGAALRFGFSNLGRFAVEYRQLFGESPSHTLRGTRLR